MQLVAHRHLDDHVDKRKEWIVVSGKMEKMPHNYTIDMHQYVLWVQRVHLLVCECGERVPRALLGVAAARRASSNFPILNLSLQMIPPVRSDRYSHCPVRSIPSRPSFGDCPFAHPNGWNHGRQKPFNSFPAHLWPQLQVPKNIIDVFDLLIGTSARRDLNLDLLINIRLL